MRPVRALLRITCAALLLAGCGAAAPATAPVDDLDLDGDRAWAAPRPTADTGHAPARPTADTRHAPARPTADTGHARPAVRVAQRTPSGPRIDLAVRDADLGDVLRLIAAAADLDLVVAGDVTGTVTLEVDGVTWRQAIDVIAHLEGLAVAERDGVVLVTRRANR